MNEESKRRVLIVDDELVSLKILANILEDEYTISVATNGKQALEVARENKPAMILLDVVMPKCMELMYAKILRLMKTCVAYRSYL